MNDLIEKVKHGLRCCADPMMKKCDRRTCPYRGVLECRMMVARDARSVIEQMEQEIERLKEQEWHLLTEDADGIIHGLPGDDGQYLMTDGKDIWIDDYVDGVDDGIWLDSGRDIREIRAWMYMPNLPKQEGR